MKFKKENVSIYVFLAALVASGGVGVFVRAFPKWDVIPYFLSILILAVGCCMLAYLWAKLKDKTHPLRLALIAAAVFIALAFGAVFLVNNVILGTKHADVAAFIMAVAFGLAFTAGCAAALFAGNEKIASRVLVPLVCALIFVPHVLSTLDAVLPEKYAHPFEDKVAATEGLSMAKKEAKLIVNADDSHWWGFWNLLAEEGRFDDESLNEYVLNYADSGVTDLLFNIFCQSSDVPTEVFTFRGDLYGQTEQNGNPVDYSNYRGLNAFYNEQKIDIFEKWIEKCKEVNIRPWITLRMNDCHDPDETTSQLRGDFFYTARENGWMIGEEYGYFRNCFNYSVPEVRQKMLDYTKEQLLHYDVYGLELDFMREIYCFDYLHADTDEIVAIMNGYLRDTAAIVKEAEEKWGHEIKLAVRLMRDLDQCRVFGFDPLTWCKEGLVDAITVTPRFSSNDSAMPIADWLARCKGVEIWAGVETLVNTNAKGCCASAEVVRGYGAQYLTAGADGLYLFNYMTSPPGVGAREKEVYATCGSLDEILKLPRRHIVTYQDTAPGGWEPYQPLPLKIKPVKLESGKTPVLQVETGYIPEGAKVTVILGLAKELKDPADLTLTVNTADGQVRATAEKTEVYGRSEADGSDVPGGYCAEDAYYYAFPLAYTSRLANPLYLSLAGSTNRVLYAEVDVTP